MQASVRYAIALLSILGMAASLVSEADSRQKEPGQSSRAAFIPIDYSYLIFARARAYGAHGKEITGQFVVDTGSQFSELDKRTADALGLNVAERGNSHYLGGSQLVQKATVPRICLGSVCAHLLKVHLMVEKTATSLEVEHSSIGTLGADFFQGYVLTIDNQNRKMALTPRPPPMSGYRTALKAPINLVDGFSFVNCKLPTLDECNLLIDTGNGETVIFGNDSAKFIRLGNVIRTTGMLSKTGDTPIKFGPIPWIEIAGRLKLSNITVGLCETKIISPLHAKYAPGLLGNGVMENYVVQINYLEKTIIFLEKR
jgi:hypothetical protein